MELQTFLFWFFAVLGVAGGIGLIINRNPVYAALSLILNFFSIAGLYLTLNAQFLAVIQIIVYAGAIMVLFLFVIMLLNLSDEPKADTLDMGRIAAYTLGGAFLVEMLYVFRPLGAWATEPAVGAVVKGDTYAKVEQVGMELMTKYVYPFEMISVILVSALIGAIVIAKKHTYSK